MSRSVLSDQDRKEHSKQGKEQVQRQRHKGQVNRVLAQGERESWFNGMLERWVEEKHRA